jgi:type II secretory pathway component GspD/PulD (secretin)
MRVAMLVFWATVAGLCTHVPADGQDIQPRIDLKRVTRLTQISRSENNSRATLHVKDPFNNSEIPLSSAEADNRFVIRDSEGSAQFEGTVVHIGARDVIFGSEGKEYAVHLGRSVAEALENPLTPAQVEAIKKQTPPQPPAKTYAFEMRDKPWGAVLEWLTDQTGLRNVSSHFPYGSFTFISPGNKTYTLPELIDILNEALIQQGYYIIRRDQSFAVVPTAEPIDPTLLPRVSPSELDQHGNNELVTMTVPLGDLDAGEVVADVRRLLGRFGSVSVISRNNQLLLQDTVRNLKRVVDVLNEMKKQQEPKAPGKTVSLEFRSSTWADVFAWLTEQTDLPVVREVKPTGTFTFVSAPSKAYSIPEVIDILNEGLLVQKLLLIRRDHSFALVSVDEPIDPALVPRVRSSELASRGNSELVSVTISLSNLSADDVAMEAERVMGPLGRAVPLSKANQIILQDTVGNLKRVMETIRAMEDKVSSRR